ncbi:MAG TPA: biotin/lipoyl-containing protein [Vicinamibacteria bacterium]
MTVRPGPGATEVTIDGQALVVGLEETGPAAYVLKIGERSYPFHCVRDADTVHLSWAGASYRLSLSKEGAPSAPRAPSSSLEAPMPGKVIAVKAVPGLVVAKGDELLVVEAMKMENALRSPRAGVVKSVKARVGDMVQPGLVLVELE